MIDDSYLIWKISFALTLLNSTTARYMVVEFEKIINYLKTK